jgi:guanine deaminase
MGMSKKQGIIIPLKADIPHDAKIVSYPKGIIVPGFIDSHIYYPQTDMIAADNGGELLDWLSKYVFLFGNKMKDKKYSEDTARFFIDELLRNGTTTANVCVSTYPTEIILI